MIKPLTKNKLSFMQICIDHVPQITLCFKVFLTSSKYVEMFIRSPSAPETLVMFEKFVGELKLFAMQFC